MSESADPSVPAPHAGFALLVNVEEITAPLPYDIAEGFTLVRADNMQIQELRRDLEPFVPHWGVTPYPTPYEFKRVPREDGGWSFVARELEDFRYFVVNFTGMGNEIHEIGLAGSLLPGEAEVEFALNYVAYAAIGFTKDMLLPNARVRSPVTSPLDLHRFFLTLSNTGGAPSQGLSRLSADDLAQFSRLYKQIQTHDESVIALKPKLYELHVLRSIDPRSRLGLVGYMTIIESLLTHKPDPKDIHESLTKQVVSKMGLLEHRISGGFGYQKWFPGKLGGNQIWRKLYGIRSAIAHGDKPEYKMGEIPDYQTALKFLREVVKTLIRQSLAEPQLIRDLHDC
ncbi:hypothetical protein [Sorangium sp. So ce1153]|uniref:hypothetical protein n=1 Tax=Sorangium sp. So ce1153 TaxID=3133333 RepID=UPI003F5DBFFC